MNIDNESIKRNLEILKEYADYAIILHNKGDLEELALTIRLIRLNSKYLGELTENIS